MIRIWYTQKCFLCIDLHLLICSHFNCSNWTLRYSFFFFFQVDSNSNSIKCIAYKNIHLSNWKTKLLIPYSHALFDLAMDLVYINNTLSPFLFIFILSLLCNNFIIEWEMVMVLTIFSYHNDSVRHNQCLIKYLMLCFMKTFNYTFYL